MNLERDMYMGPSSTRPWGELVAMFVIALFLFGAGYWMYRDILDAEITGKSIKLPAPIVGMYEFVGATGVLAFFGVCAILCVVIGIAQYRNKMK